MSDQTDIIDLVRHLGTIHGIGSISADGRMFDEISYFIEPSLLGNGNKRIDGMIDAKLAVLERVSRSVNSILTLETAEQVPIVVTHTRSGHAEFRIVGPMPASVKFDESDCPGQTDG